MRRFCGQNKHSAVAALADRFETAGFKGLKVKKSLLKQGLQSVSTAATAASDDAPVHFFASHQARAMGENVEL